MKNGDLNEIEVLLSEIPGVTYHFGVQDRASDSHDESASDNGEYLWPI